MGAVVVACAALVGCGRSPSAPDPSTPAAIGPHARCAQFVPPVDEDEDDGKVPVPCEHRGVTYVPLAAWTPSERVKRLETTMPEREASAPATLMTFPKLTLHRGIGETTWQRAWRRRR